MKSLYALFKTTSSPAKTTSISASKATISIPSASKNLKQTHFISLIHASKTTCQLRQIHAQVVLHSLASSSLVTTQLISASSLRKSIDYSVAIFDRCHPKNLFLFNALIRGLESNSRFDDAVSHFILMLRSGIKPDRLTVPFVLKSVAGLRLKRFGGTLHALLLKNGLEFDLFVVISLVDMYVKFGRLGLALKAFEQSPQRFNGQSTLLWNVVIDGCCKVGNMGKAKELFEALPEKNTASWNSLINGFLRNGDVDQAIEVFNGVPDKDVISWTMIVHGLSQNGHHQMGLSMFSRMLGEGLRPNDFTVVSALSACAKVGALETGSHIHKYLSNNGFRLNGAIGTALVDMYAKCGNIELASQVFGEVKEKDIRTWNAMIWGWAIHGRFQQAMQCFRQMMYSGLKPDEAVFLAIITACLHSGEANLGLTIFNSLRLDYSIEPNIKHYTLIVELLGRATRLKEAFRFIENMPMDPTSVIWGTLFCACMAQKNNKMAELAAQKLLQLGPNRAVNRVFLSNVYSAVGKWKDVERIQVLKRNTNTAKDTGCSFIEMDGLVHSFSAGDHAHQDAKGIYAKLDEIMVDARKLGYMPGNERVVHDIEEEEKEDTLGSHSEKLALSFGLIRSPRGMTIRIVKNLRICGDCHSFMKYASKTSKREIVLRDVKRFHRFKGGACSCGDFW